MAGAVALHLVVVGMIFGTAAIVWLGGRRPPRHRGRRRR